MATKILVVGAGDTGSRVIQQLRKNSEIEIVVLDPRQNPSGLKNGVIDKVDIAEALTPLTLDYILERCRPDMILLASHAEDMGLGNVGGADLLSHSLRDELAAISPVPVVEVERAMSRN